MQLTRKQAAIRNEWRRLLIEIKKSTYWPDFNEPDTMNGGDGPSFQCVTIGADSELNWSFQTGDNSYTGGAYGFPHWALVWIRPRSNSLEVANEAMDQILDLIAQSSEVVA